MGKRHRPLRPDEPLRHADHPRPVSRREFIRQGFLGGAGLVLTGGVFSLFADPRAAHAAVASDLTALAADIGCELGGLSGDSKIPFICFDLAGGGNLAGSNVLVGKAAGQMDFLTAAGYSKVGLPGEMVPGLAQGTRVMLNPSDGDFTNSSLGLRFHADSALLYGIRDKAGTALTTGVIDGSVIPARSENDTANNPHNPLYAIARTGAKGGVVTLIGSQTSESGGNSVAPAGQIDPTIRPTKVDRPSDVTGMVDVGDLTAVLSDPDDVTAVMESMARITHKKLSLGTVQTGVSRDEVIKDLMQCGYLKAADIADRFAGVQVDPSRDGVIVEGQAGGLPGIPGIFTAAEFNGDGEFRKTASVMKMVIDGHAGAGCITMGGFDYHTSDRQTGENRDLRAGRCIGACLAYAAARGKPLMIYVYSDGALSSSGQLDNSAPTGGNELGGRGKGVWTGDNSDTACSFFLVYRPSGVIPLYNNGLSAGQHRQIGYFSGDGSVVTSGSPAANNVEQLVNMVVLNYMALHGEEGNFGTLFPTHGLGSVSSMSRWIAFSRIT